jgi:DNA-binding CsgD family transcriptional regulator/tetratricopeptide (TPR) repeat protein
VKKSFPHPTATVRNAELPGGELIGRSAERAELLARISRIDEEGCSVIIRGPAGVGKTSILAAAAAMAKDGGLLLLEGAGLEAESMLPFAGLRQILEPLLSNNLTLPLVQKRALLTAFGLQEGPPPQLFLVALATLTLITDSAASIPVVVIVDDVQWMDSSTNDVLAFIARRVQYDPVVILAGLREGHQVALALTDTREINLAGLDEASSHELLTWADDRLTGDARTAILAQAQGNPLALVELPKAWHSAGSDALHAMSTTVPLTVRLERAFASRIMDLPVQTRDALLVSAVNSDESTDEIIAGTAILCATPVPIETLDPAREAGLISFDALKVRFRHPLVRSAVLQNEPAARRQAAHAALSVSLRSHPLRSVWHQAQSVDGPDDDIADLLFSSHTESIARGSVVTAVSILERSAELTADTQTRGRRLLLAAQYAFSLGRVELVNRLVESAVGETLSAPDLARVEWLREIFTEGELGDSERILALCDLAANCAESGDSDLALDLLSSAALRSWWAIPAFSVRERLVSVAESLTKSQDDARCIAAIALTEPLAKGRQTAARLTSVASLGASSANRLVQLGNAARAIGAEVSATDFFARAESKIREQGQLGLLPHVLAVNAAVCIDLGDWRRAAQSLDEARRVATETGQPTWTTGVRAVEAVYLALRGDTEGALRQAASLYRTWSGRGANDFLSLAQFARGAAYLSVGQHATAYTELKPLFDDTDPRHHPRESLSALTLLVEAAGGCGELDDVRAVVDRMEALAEETQSPILITHLLYARAVLAPNSEAEQLFETGLAQDLTRWPWPRARIQLAYGNWLRRQHRAVDSREPLRSALATFELIGASGWVRQARASLRAAGDRDNSITEGSSESLLNAHEMQIARLAADGLSNREIGQQLYLSPRTVGSHLYRIYPKLGITSRAELVDRLRH